MTPAERHAKIYGVTPVQISRWKSAGAGAHIPPPLDDPEKMPGWWESMVQRGVFQKSVPVNIQAAADRARKLMGLDDDEAEEPGEMPDAPNDYGKIGISDSIRIAGKNIVFLEMCLDGAMKLKNLKEAATYRKQLNEAMDLLRALEKDRGKIDLESRTMLPKEEIRAAMMELHANIQKQIRQHLRHAFMDAPDHLASRERWCSFVDGIVDLACSALIKSDFAA